ncbi:hypothetical protein Tco_1570938 [Tanacetum coccineum]
MESNKSIHRSDEQKNLYKALVEAYESDKLILDTYGDTVSFKRRRDDEDKDEEPSARSNRGSKTRRAGKEPESTSTPKEKDTPKFNRQEKAAKIQCGRSSSFGGLSEDVYKTVLSSKADGTLDDVQTALNDRLKGIRIEYLPQTIWRQSDMERAKAIIQAIDKQLKLMRIMRSLERFVGGRSYGGEFWLLQRTI